MPTHDHPRFLLKMNISHKNGTPERERTKEISMVNPDSLFRSCYVSNCFHSGACLVFFSDSFMTDCMMHPLQQRPYPCQTDLLTD